MPEESFSYVYVTLKPSNQIGMHRQDTWELSYVLTGAGTRYVGNDAGPFLPGDLVLIPPGVPHRWVFDDGATDGRGRIANISVMFGNDLLRMMEAFPEYAAVVESIKDITEALVITGVTATHVTSLLKSMRSESNECRLLSLFRILYEISESSGMETLGSYRQADATSDRLDQVRTYVVCNAARKITLDDISSHVGMNRSAFCVFFKKATGSSFLSYLTGYRIELACDLLHKGGMTVSEICYQCGFNDVPHFIRTFKKAMGLPPLAWLSLSGRR